MVRWIISYCNIVPQTRQCVYDNDLKEAGVERPHGSPGRAARWMGVAPFTQSQAERALQPLLSPHQQVQNNK